MLGPKIDITIRDALNRKHQCATIQLDFQLPERFNLTYVPPDAEPNKVYRPVIIHRAILGSVERVIAILTEHFAGKWPFWLSPRQVAIIPIAVAYYGYAEQVYEAFHNAGFYTEVDLGENTFNKKIRNAEISQVNFILVVGEQEMQNQTVNVRNRDDEVKGRNVDYKIVDVIEKMRRLKEEQRSDNKLE
jgi:threonyl-tRNA synthetase